NAFNGQRTFYSTSLEACGDRNSDGDLICVLNSAQFGNRGDSNNNENYDKRIIIKGSKGSVTVTMKAKCPSCDLDKSP
ncbi:hypothetical protein C1645_677640, partial [Glomus cerebriforme]